MIKIQPQHELNKYKENFRIITDQLLNGIVILQKGFVKYTNSATSEIFEYPKEEIEEWSTDDLFNKIYPEDIPIIDKKIKERRRKMIDTILQYSLRIITKLGNIKWIEVSYKPILFAGEDATLVMFQDISFRREADLKFKESIESLRKSQKELLIRDQISKIFLTVSNEEMYGKVLEVILKAFESRYGVFGYIDEKGNLVCPSMTTEIWEKCQMEDKTIIFPQESWGGILGRTLLEKKIFYSNEPFKVPEGHIQIFNALDVPMIYQNEMIGNILIGNKINGYSAEDKIFLESIAGLIAPILYERLKTIKLEREREQSNKKLIESQYNLQERLKELTCLYGISKVFERPDMSIDEIFNEILHLIPPAWQYPSITCARIIFKGKKYKNLNFKETRWNLSSEKVVNNGILKIEVYYHENKPFLKEEEYLINEIAERLKNIIVEKLAEYRILESEERFHKIFEEGPLGMVIVSLDFRIMKVNSKLCDKLGYDEKELTKFTFLDITHPEDRYRDAQLAEQLFKGDIPFYSIEKRYYKKNKEILWAKLTCSVIHDKNGKVIYGIGMVEDITKQKKAEKRIKEQFLFLNNIIEALPHPLYVMNVENYQIELANSMTIPDKSSRKLTCYNLFHNRDKPCKDQHTCPLEIVKKTKKSIVVEYLHLDKDGNPRYYEVHGHPLLDKNSNVIKIIGYNLDITERKKSEEKIIDQAKFPSENPNPVLRVTKNKVIYANQVSQDLFHTKQGEVIPDVLREIVNELFLEQSTQDIEIEANNRIFSLIITPIKDQNYVNIYGRDITERKKIEKKYIDLNVALEQKIIERTRELKESEQKFRNMIHDLDVGYYNVGMDGKIIFHNSAFNKIAGYDPSENLIGSEAMDFWYNPIDRKIFMEQILNKEHVENFVTNVKKKNGEKIFVELNSHLVKDELGDPISIEGIIIDITEKLEYEQKLKEETIRLREINEFKTNLLNRTSHELQTPLISIKGFTDILLSKYEHILDTDMADYLEIINKNANRLVKTIRSMIDTAYLEKEIFKINVYTEDLAFLIRNCVKNYQRLIKLRKQSVVLDIQDILITKLDKEGIYRVLESLFENAINNTPTGGKIEIQSEIKGGNIIVSIKDNGVGLTKEEQEQLFQPFGKIERYGRGVDVIIEGPGLSLYICKKIIELHGGEIWVASKGRNKGSIFYFSIPIISE